MTTGEYVLAIDLGTGGPKVAVATPEGEVVAHEFRPTKLHLIPGGGAEQNPDDWWEAITGAARHLLEARPVPVDAITSVACTAQWSGTVPVDESGRALGNALIWMDSRGADAVRRIVGGFPRIQGYGLWKIRRWIRLTGGGPGLAGKDPIAHILYLREANPDLYRATWKFLEPADYLNLRLTGRCVASFDTIVLHWVTDNRDVTRIDYDRRLLALATLERTKLPDLVPPATVVGSLRPDAAEELGLPAGIDVVTATGDIHSAAVGSGAVRDFEPHLYVGTSSWLSCHVPFKRTSISTNVASLPAAVPGRYFVADEHETAGACLTFLRDGLLFPEDGLSPAVAPGWETFDRVAEEVAPGAGGVIFTPWLQGERTPVDDHTVRGAFVNLSLSTTRAELVRSVYEGVALNNRWLRQVVERFVKRRLGPIRFIGGGANSDVWAQIHADVLDRPVHRVAEPILANVRGAALLSGLARGRVGVDEAGRKVPVDAVFEPRPELRALYDELFREFVTIYRQTRDLYRRLSTLTLP